MSALRAGRTGIDSVLGRGVNFTHQAVGAHVDPQELRGYWSDLRHKARDAAGRPGGLPWDETTGRQASWVIPLAQAALGWWDLRLEGRAGDAPFQRLARRLLDDAQKAPDGELAWPVPVPVAKYDLEPGWTSAMGQGQAISVLLRLHRLTGDPRHADAARAALGPLLRPVDRGGLQRRVGGALVLEEYPAPEPVAVLNGWIFALFGVWELAREQDDPEAAELFDLSYAGVIELLPRFAQPGWWSLYSLAEPAGRPDLAKPFYQRLAPELLDALGTIRPHPVLAGHSARWRRQLTAPAIVRAAGAGFSARAARGRSRRVAPSPPRR